MTFSPGDVGSTSALGGALRTQARRLADLVVDLDATARRAGRTGSPDATGTERDLVARAATELDRVGGLLQSWTTTAVESAARVRTLEPALTRCDLVIDGQLVVERSGPSRVEPAERLAERERLQELLNRVTAVRSREQARLRRELEASTATLAALSDRARSGA
ncbi:hypothetical protein GCM10009868_27040 [Terrabacter aerolatus]|uniref:Uncharacterized protein n=1 Tax=Terrabacter aerolatus TaxID=422442 RepID=A0A512CWU2_9MICO|nr:hypothetical protein [Terrabacter aerolatus]GEO28691.1 hypothetical protein TAE01_05010 [Terrabacter aerolatus]